MPLSPDEIDDLKSDLKKARKKPFNFGLCLESDVDESILLLHRRKAPELLLRRAKAQGDTTKFTMGQLRMEGKVVILECTMDAPANCARQLRLFLRGIGVAVKVEVTDPKGTQDSVLKSINAPPAEAAPAPFKKAQLLWATTQTKMKSEIIRLQTAIIETCGTDPDLKTVATEAADLPSRLDVFDGELDKRLGDLVGTTDGSSLDALKAQARATVQEYETALLDPFFAELDTNNGFIKVAVTSSAKQSLTAISKVLM